MRWLLASVFSLSACGGAVAPSSDAAVAPTPEAEWKDTASCDAVRASCGGDPAMLVRGHASGLVGLDGARVEFAVRYVLVEGGGLDVPHGVALGRTRVGGGAFATCVCVPHGANLYPQIAAVVYATGTAGLSSRDVARGTFSQRYATLGDEDVSGALAVVPSDLQKEAAVAAMVERTAKVTLELGAAEGRAIHGGLVADERPLAAQIATASIPPGPATLTWTMPGRAWASERVAFFVDQNGNGKCDDADRGAVVPFAPTIKLGGEWLTGSALSVVCDALQIGVARE